MDAQQHDRLARLAARGRVSSTTPPADATTPVAATPMAATPAGGLDDAQAARLTRLAGKGRVSRTAAAAPAAPAPAAAARAAMPLPPPDPRFIIESDPVTAVLPVAGRAHLDPPPAKASKRVSARDIIGAMPAGIEPRERKGRRKHAAIAGRIVVVGMTTSAFLGGLAALASAPPPAWEKNNAKTAEAASETESTDADAAATEDATDDEAATDETVADAASTTAPPPVQDTIYVIQKVPRVIYVDENGNPLDPNAAPAVAEEPAADGGAPAAPAAKPKAKTGGGGGGGGGAPAPAADPAPAAAAPAAAAPAAPAATQAPATTAAPKPKPTTPPTTACTGSKC